MSSHPGIVRLASDCCAHSTAAHSRFSCFLVQYALDHSDKVPTPIRGVVIGKRNRGMDSAFTILNVSHFMAPSRPALLHQLAAHDALPRCR